MMRAAVLWRDEHLIALNKPPGLPSQGGSGQSRHVDGLAEALAEGGEKPRLVHRLDRDTSGVLLLARTRPAAKALAEAFRHRETRKIYWAAVAGVPHPAMGTIRYGLVKAPGHGPKGEGERMHTVHPDAVDATPGAQAARTDYAVLERLGKRAAWVAMVPVTGRTHQLRAHMAALGHPVAGDGKYGGSGQENLGDGWGAGLGGALSRKLHLHARSIALTHPFTGARLQIVAPLPEHMARTWEAVGWDPREAPADPFEAIVRHLVIFDVDGTLVDSQGHIHAAMTAAFEGEGREPPSRDAVRGVIGLSLPQAIGRLAGRPAPDLVEAYKDAYAALAATAGSAEAAPLFPGAREALDALAGRGFALGIATGKSRRGLASVLATHGLAGVFETVQVADDHPSKPHPSMIHAALAEADVASERAVMLGDTVFDIDMALAAGVPALGVAWGYHAGEALIEAGAGRVLDAYADLLPALDALWGTA